MSSPRTGLARALRFLIAMGKHFGKSRGNPPEERKESASPRKQPDDASIYPLF